MRGWFLVLALLLMSLQAAGRELTEGEVLRALSDYSILVVEVTEPARVRVLETLKGSSPEPEMVEAIWEKPLDPRRRVLEPGLGQRMIVVADVSSRGSLTILAYARYLDSPERRAWVREETREGCHCEDSR